MSERLTEAQLLAIENATGGTRDDLVAEVRRLRALIEGEFDHGNFCEECGSPSPAMKAELQAIALDASEAPTGPLKRP